MSMTETIAGIMTVIGLIGFFGSFVLLIKPTFFHKKLNRKKVGLLILGFFLLMVCAPSTPEQKAAQEAEHAQAEARRQEEAQADAQLADAQKQAEEALDQMLNGIIVSTSIYPDSIGTPNLKITFNNNLEKTIDGIEVMMNFTNNFDEPVGKWDRNVEEPFIAQAQETITPGSTKSVYWNLAVYESATNVTNIQVIRISFTDGTELTRY